MSPRFGIPAANHTPPVLRIKSTALALINGHTKYFPDAGRATRQSRVQ